MKLADLTPLAKDAPDTDVTGLCADSRAVEAGDLFAALPGSQADGRRFIADAVARGAAAVLAPKGTAALLPEDVAGKIVLIESAEPRLDLARIAARFSPGQPAHVVGITGTNGKTSVARFTAQLWSALGHNAGTLGTLGASAPGYDYALRHTTPDPIEIHHVVSTIARLGTTHLAMEVSSHGLSQYRADAMRFEAAGFTNITQDHLDYHPSFEAYFDAKSRLFTELLPQSGTVVINADGAHCEEAARRARAAGRSVFTVGRAGRNIVLRTLAAKPEGLDIEVEAGGRRYGLSLPLIGAFQADNALVAAGLVMVTGAEAPDVLPLLEGVTAAPGRMELAALKETGAGAAAVYVDYAHTPDAVSTALAAIRPHAKGRVHIVLGAGGDRDKIKRPAMGKAAATGADVVIVTDDNPRTEEPGPIREAVAAGAGGQAVVIGDRRAAIGRAVEGLMAGDVLLIAGKGHEKYQIIGEVTYPFDDVAVAKEAASAAAGEA